MQWLSLLISFLLGKTNFSRGPSLRDSVTILFEEAGKRSRKPALMVLGGLTCVLLLCGGFFMGLIDLTTQADRNGGNIQPTASATSGFALVVIAAGIFTWIFTRAWPGVKAEREKKAEIKEHHASTLEQALTLLVMDYIKEREMKREERHQQQHPSPASTMEREPSPPLHH